MMALTDTQIAILKSVAEHIPVEKRDLLLRRTAAMMKFRSRTDDDLRECLTLATVGLVQADGFVIPE